MDTERFMILPPPSVQRSEYESRSYVFMSLGVASCLAARDSRAPNGGLNRRLYLMQQRWHARAAADTVNGVINRLFEDRSPIKVVVTTHQPIFQSENHGILDRTLRSDPNGDFIHSPCIPFK